MAIVSDEQVVKVLRQYNPWWRNPSTIKEESKPQKRLAYYEALKMIKHKTLRRFAVLSGARRVGKTTIIHAIHKALSFMMYPDNIYESVKSKGKKSKRKIQDVSMDDLNVYLSLLTPQMWDVTLKYSFFKTI